MVGGMDSTTLWLPLSRAEFLVTHYVLYYFTKYCRCTQAGAINRIFQFVNERPNQCSQATKIYHRPSQVVHLQYNYLCAILSKYASFVGCFAWSEDIVMSQTSAQGVILHHRVSGALFSRECRT